MVNYPKEFRDKCKELFPKWNELHKAIENGSIIVEKYLEDSFSRSILVVEVLSAKSLSELQTRARQELEKKKLYEESKKIIEK